MIESGEVRNRLRQTIEAARREAAARRAALGDVQKEYDAFLENQAAPVFRQIVSSTRKSLGDNADAIYFDTAVSNAYVYRVTGNTAGAGASTSISWRRVHFAWPLM